MTVSSTLFKIEINIGPQGLSINHESPDPKFLRNLFPDDPTFSNKLAGVVELGRKFVEEYTRAINKL